MSIGLIGPVNLFYRDMVLHLLYGRQKYPESDPCEGITAQKRSRKRRFLILLELVDSLLTLTS